jgi:hypothetical protein
MYAAGEKGVQVRICRRWHGWWDGAASPLCAEPTRTRWGVWKEGVFGSGIAGVGVGFVGALWIIWWWLVVRGYFSAKISWEGSCRVGGESGDWEALSMRTISRRGRRQGSEGRFGVHEKERKRETSERTEFG